MATVLRGEYPSRQRKTQGDLIHRDRRSVFMKTEVDRESVSIEAE